MSEHGEQPAPEPGTVPPPPAGPPTGMPYGYPMPTYFAPTPLQYGYPKDHPRAGLAFGLGLGGLIGGFVTLGFAFGIGPFAWYFGQRARAEIRRSNGAYHPEGNATAGMVMGIISTVFLVIAALLWAALLSGGFDTGSSSGGVSA